jgi:hypothetical protein
MLASVPFDALLLLRSARGDRLASIRVIVPRRLRLIESVVLVLALLRHAGSSLRATALALRASARLAFRSALVLDLRLFGIAPFALSRRVRLAHLLLTLLDHWDLPETLFIREEI